MTADIVLWLDLSELNQQDEASVRASVPDGAEILRLTENGIKHCGEGTPARWRPVLDAIDSLLHSARERERRSSACRYWVTGRAGLPAFFYLGRRLGKMAAITFVHQPRNGGPAVALPLDARVDASQSTAYFARSPWPISASDATAPVALAVSSLQNPADAAILDAFAGHKTRPAAIVHSHADAALDGVSMPVAIHELDELIRAVGAAHPKREALAVFIAGPSSLAFVVGNALNARVCRDIQVYGYDGARYTLAYELPYPPIPARNVALWLGASPAGTTQLALDEEIRAINLEQGRATVGDRLVIVPIPAARPVDLLRQLQDRRPGVIQFSGHGSSGGPVFQNDQGCARELGVDDLLELLRQAGDPVHLVVIAACYSEVYVEALLNHVECVIGMRGLVGDTDARRFATELYRSLAEGDSVRVAFDRALLVMRLERSTSTRQSPDGEAPQLRERILGCADTLFLVRRP